MKGRWHIPLWKLTGGLALALLLVNAAAYLAFTRPREERSRRAKVLAQELQTTLAAERAGVERLRRRAKAIEDNGRDTRLFLSQTLATQRAGLAADLDALEAAFRESGVHVSRRAYHRQALRGVDAVRLEHVLSLTGTPAQVASFLGRIESGPRFLVITRLRLSHQQAEGRASVEATIASFYRPDDGEAAPVDAGADRPTAAATRPGA